MSSINTIESKKPFREKIMIDAEDKDVAVTVIYTADGEAFSYDAAGKVAVEAKDMFNLFIKGVVAVKDAVYYRPTSCTKEGVIKFDFPSSP